MKRLAALLILSGFASASLAEEPSFCTSTCASEKNTCHAGALKREALEAQLPTDMPDKNPFARTAQLQMRSNDGGALEHAGFQHRRMARAEACDAAYQRCTRSCGAPDSDKAEGAVVSRHVGKTG